MRFEIEINLFKKQAIKKRFQANETAVSVIQGKISALISESELQELENGESTMYSKMASVILEIDELKLDFSDLNTKYDTVTGQYSELDSKVAEYKAGIDGLSADITSVQQSLSDDYSTTEEMNTAIQAKIGEIELSVSSTYATQAALDAEANKIILLEEWKNQASIKIEDDAIVSTVRKSSEYMEDLAEKVGTGEIISRINQTAEDVTIDSGRINFNGLVTANNYFKILTDGAFVAKYGTIADWVVNTNYIQSSDGTITLYNNYKNTGTAAIEIGASRLEAEGSAMVVKYGLHIYTGTDEFSDGTDKLKIYNLLTVSSGQTLVMNDNFVQVLSSSSKRYKNHIRYMESGEAGKIYDVPVVWFSYIDGYLAANDPKVNQPIPGFYADDIDIYLPDAAVYNSAGLPEDWNPRTLLPYVVKALQDLKNENNELRLELERLVS